MKVLFRRYVNRKPTWDAFIQHVVDKPSQNIEREVVHYLAHIPWHPDIAWTGEEPISTAIRDYGRRLLHTRFRRAEVIKLLECVDDEGLDRGSTGQSVLAVISCVEEIGPILAGIVRDVAPPMRIREIAVLIIAQREGTAAIPIATELAQSGSELAREIAYRLRQEGQV